MQCSVRIPVDVSSYLARHDIVYLSPPLQGYEGFPLGNGDLGAMLWCTASGFTVQINKSDCWDQPGPECGMLLRSCARLSVDLGVPCFDWVYLDDFEARLSLADARVDISAAAPYLAASARAFVRAEHNVFLLSCRAEGRGELAGSGTEAAVALERWGSRAFGWWYSGVSAGAEQGLGGARARVLDGTMIIEEAFEGLSFAVACRLLGPGAENAQARRVNAHRAEARMGCQAVQDFTVAVAVVTSGDSSRPTEDAIALLDETARAGVPQADAAHRRSWAGYWDKSFVHLGDDYLENLYYLHLYLMGSGSRGRYPVMFNAGLWTWNRDVRNWCYPHHWNMQQAYWSLCPANRPELMAAYLETYLRLAPHAERYAESRGFPGAIMWNEMHDYAGRMLSWQNASLVNNFTPATQIGLSLWTYCRFTGDDGFLQSKAYPFMKKAAAFYLQYLQWDERKGEYFIHPASPYECESGNSFRNTTTDLAAIRASFAVCIEASVALGVDAELRQRWQKVLDHVPPYPMVELPEGDMIGIAQDAAGTTVRLGGQEWGFCTTTSPVFPAGVLGIKDQGTPLFDAAVRRVRAHPEHSLAISPVAVVAARLGMGDEALQRLEMSVRQLQHFPQGLFYNIDHWHQYSHYADKVPDAWTFSQRDYINDRACRYGNIPVRGTDQRIDMPMEPFVQCGMEPLAILAAAVNEMLLQSHEGFLRIFPAAPTGWECSFTLRARGGFLVSAERKAAGTPWVCIESLLGDECRMVPPWKGPSRIVRREPGPGTTVAFSEETGAILAFKTEKGAVYELRPATAARDKPAASTGDKPAAGGEPAAGDAPPAYAARRNMAPKRFQEAILGKPREFGRKEGGMSR